MDDDITGDDFEGYESSFEDEEVVPGCNAEGFIDVPTCESNEGRRDGQVSDHFSHT